MGLFFHFQNNAIIQFIFHLSFFLTSSEVKSKLKKKDKIKWKQEIIKTASAKKYVIEHPA